MAYFWKNSLRTWYQRGNLDKSIQSFIVGTIISTITVGSFNPPLTSQTLDDWSQWVKVVGLPVFLLEPLVILVVMLIITQLMQIGQDYRKAPVKMSRRLTILAVGCIAGLAALLVAYVTIPLVLSSPLFHEYASLILGAAAIITQLCGLLSARKAVVGSWADLLEDFRIKLKGKSHRIRKR